MLLQLLLNLRNERERVTVIHRPGQPHPELGAVYPQEDTRRADIPGHWGMVEHQRREEPLATIDVPLPTRTQTILSYHVPHHVRQAINGDVTDSTPASRKHGIEMDLKL